MYKTAARLSFVMVASALVCLLPAAPVVHAQSYSISAEVPDNYTNNSTCSLREAVTAAITNTARDNCPAGSSVAADTILLESGKTYLLQLSGSNDTNISGDIDFVSGEAGLSLDLIIKTDGEAPATIIQQVSGERVFDNFGADVLFENVTISGGTGGSGAGIRGTSGSLALDGVTVSGNVATNSSSFGGGVWISDTSSAAITDSVISENAAANGYGGGLYAFGPVTIRNTLFLSNAASEGGGAAGVYGTSAVFVNSTFSGNSVSGILPAGSDIQGSGGAVLTINNSTFTGGDTVSGAVIVAESGSTGSVTNSIITAASTADATCMAIDNAGDAALTGGSNRVHVLGSDCDGTGTAVLSANSLTPLGSGGGQTRVMLLRPGSNALAAGSPASCDALDARGVTRRIGVGLCDVGAVEMFRLSLTASGATPEGGSVDYTVSLAPAVPSGMTVPVSVFTAQGSAAAGSDYVDTSALLTFDSAHAARTLTVDHLADDIDEADEVYAVHLYQDAGLVLADAALNGTITDDDTAGVNVTPTSFNLTEGGAAVPVSFKLTSQPAADVSVTVTYQGEDLSLGILRTTANFSIAPADWNTAVSLSISAIGDALNEGGEVEIVSFALDSADPNYDSIPAASLNATVLEADSNLVINGGFEQDGLGGANASDKKALGWVTLPKPNSSSRRACKPSGDASPCAWAFKGGTTAQSIKQTLSLPAYTVGDMLVMTGRVRRANIGTGVSAKLLIKFTDGQKDSAALKFAAGSDGAFTIFTRQLALNDPLANISSVAFTLTNKAQSGKIYFDDISVYVQPRFPRDGGDVLPPPAAPAGLRGLN